MVERLLFLLPDKTVMKYYEEAGADFGSAVSMLALGECQGFEAMLNRWAKWERECARRNYKTISVDRFVRAGGYGEKLPELGEKQSSGEEVIYHAEIYRRLYLGKIQPQLNLEALMTSGEMQVGTYEVPSTEMEKNK